MQKCMFFLIIKKLNSFENFVNLHEKLVARMQRAKNALFGVFGVPTSLLYLFFSFIIYLFLVREQEQAGAQRLAHRLQFNIQYIENLSRYKLNS